MFWRNGTKFCQKLLFIQYRIFLISLSVWDNSYLENAKVIVICMLFKRTLLDAKIKMAISRIFINSNKFCNNSKSVVVFSNSASFHTSRFRSLEKEPHIIKSRFEDVPLSKQPFSEFLWSNSEKFSQRTSLVRSWRVCIKNKHHSSNQLIFFILKMWKRENAYFQTQGPIVLFLWILPP